MLTASEKNWEQARQRAFWSSNLSKEIWRQAILEGDSGILETSLEWMRPDVFIYHLGHELYKELWPALRQHVKITKLFSGINLSRRLAYYDAWWSKLVCGRSWLYPFFGWQNLSAQEKSILAETAAFLYSPDEALAQFGQNQLPAINKLLEMGFFKVLDMPEYFGSSSRKKVYFPVKP